MKLQLILGLIFSFAMISQNALAISWPSWLKPFSWNQDKGEIKKNNFILSSDTSTQSTQKQGTQIIDPHSHWDRPELSELISSQKLNEAYQSLFAALQQGMVQYKSQAQSQPQKGSTINLDEMVNDSFFEVYDSIYAMDPLDFNTAVEKIRILESLFRGSRYMSYEYVQVWSGATAQLTFWRERNGVLIEKHPLPPKFQKPSVTPSADSIFANLTMSNSMLLGIMYKNLDETLTQILRGMTPSEEIGFLRSMAFSDQYYYSHPMNRFENVPGMRDLLVSNNEWSHFIGATRVASATHLMEIDTVESWREVFLMFFGDNISTPNGGVLFELQDLLAEYMTYYKSSHWNDLLPALKDRKAVQKVFGQVDQWKIDQGLRHIRAAVEQATNNINKSLGIVSCKDVFVLN